MTQIINTEFKETGIVQLLMKQRLKIYEVAFKLGYENAGYFAKVFKKYTGCTPKEYMERK